MRTSLCMLLSSACLLLASGLSQAQPAGYPPPPAQGQQAPMAASAPITPPPANHTPTVDETEASCRARWKAYRASLECFAPYRRSEHVIDIEAYKHCKVVKEPTDCPPQYQ